MDLCKKSSTFIPELLNLCAVEKRLNSDQKEKDFLKIFYELSDRFRQEGLPRKTQDICKLVAKMPAPSFYVTAESALHKYYEYRRNPDKFLSQRRDGLFTEIIKRYEEIRSKYGTSINQYNIMEHVVSQQAPSFYLTDESAIVFYYRAMRNKRKRARL